MTTIGVKGSDVYTSEGLGDALLALSMLLTRGVSYLDVNAGVQAVLDSYAAKVNPELMIENLLVLAFQTRDIRGGKGERLASEHLFKSLLSRDLTRKVTFKVIDLLVEYGCWRDLFSLGTYNLGTYIVDLVEKQVMKDEVALAAGESVSLLAKWMPREGHPDVTPFVIRLVPGTMLWPTRLKLYRKRIVRLNKAINTVEIKMCANTWSSIDPGVVPGRAMQKYTKAFLNELGTKKKDEKPKSGLRHPENEDRMECRQNFQEYLYQTTTGRMKAKGSDTLFPHELVKDAMGLLENSEPRSYDEMNRIEGVWKSMVTEATKGGGLTDSLAMCDFSGSMRQSGKNNDTPYWVSLALGLLISEINQGAFKDTILGFDSTPNFHRFPPGGLFHKLRSLDQGFGHGLSTDFQAAMNLVLMTLKQKRIKAGEEPKHLIVLTDMAWDKASGSSDPGYYTGNEYRHMVKTMPWQTHVEIIREAFKRAGEDMWGEGQGWTMPCIVIWNLADTCRDFHAKADTEGVVMLSGWSPSLFKVLQTEGVKLQTPMKALEVQLQNERYDLVRKRVKHFYSPDY